MALVCWAAGLAVLVCLASRNVRRPARVDRLAPPRSQRRCGASTLYLRPIFHRVNWLGGIGSIFELVEPRWSAPVWICASARAVYNRFDLVCRWSNTGPLRTKPDQPGLHSIYRIRRRRGWVARDKTSDSRCWRRDRTASVGLETDFFCDFVGIPVVADLVRRRRIFLPLPASRFGLSGAGGHGGSVGFNSNGPCVATWTPPASSTSVRPSLWSTCRAIIRVVPQVRTLGAYQSSRHSLCLANTAESDPKQWSTLVGRRGRFRRISRPGFTVMSLTRIAYSFNWLSNRVFVAWACVCLFFSVCVCVCLTAGSIFASPKLAVASSNPFAVRSPPNGGRENTENNPSPSIIAPSRFGAAAAATTTPAPSSLASFVKDGSAVVLFFSLVPSFFRSLHWTNLPYLLEMVLGFLLNSFLSWRFTSSPHWNCSVDPLNMDMLISKYSIQ